MRDPIASKVPAGFGARQFYVVVGVRDGSNLAPCSYHPLLLSPTIPSAFGASVAHLRRTAQPSNLAQRRT